MPTPDRAGILRDVLTRLYPEMDDVPGYLAMRSPGLYERLTDERDDPQSLNELVGLFPDFEAEYGRFMSGAPAVPAFGGLNPQIFGGATGNPGSPATGPGQSYGFDPSAVGVLSTMGNIGGLLGIPTPFGLMANAIKLANQFGLVPFGKVADIDDITGLPVTVANPSDDDVSSVDPATVDPGVVGLGIGEPGIGVGAPGVGDPGGNPGDGVGGEGEGFLYGGLVPDRAARSGGAEPITAHQGEYVVNAPATVRNRRLLEAINGGASPLAIGRLAQAMVRG